MVGLMSEKFDVKVYARSLSKMMAMADVAITKPGGAIHTQRLIDYVSNEFQRMSTEQTLAVLEAIDSNYVHKLFKDGNGATIGYAYSKKIFVGMRHHEWEQRMQPEFASNFVKTSKRKSARPKTKK